MSAIPPGPNRERVLYLLDRIWEEACAFGSDEACELADLADASNPNVSVDYREWLEEVL